MVQWKYFKDAEFVFNGTQNDSTLIYKGVEFNSNIVLDTIWERFQEYALEIGIDSESEENFTEYCNNSYDEIEELMELAIENQPNMPIIFASNLPHNIFTELKSDYFNRIKGAGIYNEAEIEEFMAELGDQKIGDLQDAIDPLLWAYCVEAANGMPLYMMAKLYKRYDIQDESDYSYCTFEQAREWLADFWAMNPDEDTTEEEDEQHVQYVMQVTSVDELDDMLQGIDYAIEEAF